MPIIAIATLHAGPFEVGLLLTVEQLPQLLFPLIAGAWIDRLPKRSVLLVCDIGRAAVLIVVPLTAWVDLLSMPILFVTGFVAGTFTTWHKIAWQSMLPLVTERGDLIPAAAAIGQVEAIAEVGGPMAGGGLVGLVGGPAAILVDALSFAGSALLIRQLPRNERLHQGTHPPILGQIRQGVAYIARDPILRAIGLSGSVGVFAFAMRAPLLSVFLLDEKGLSPGRYGLIFSLSAVGFLLGSFLPNPVARRIGVGNAIVWPHIGFGLAFAGVALAVSLDHRAPLIIAVMLMIEGVFEPINNINQLSLRLSLMPAEMRGRLTSVVRFLVRGSYPIGALLGGWLGERIGISWALWIAVAGMPLGMLCYWGSGVLAYRTLPSLPIEAAPAIGE